MFWVCDKERINESVCPTRAYLGICPDASCRVKCDVPGVEDSQTFRENETF